MTGSALILILCFVFRNMPVGVRGGIAAMSQLDKSLDEASSDDCAQTASAPYGWWCCHCFVGDPRGTRLFLRARHHVHQCCDLSRQRPVQHGDILHCRSR